MSGNPEWFDGDGEMRLVDGQAVWFKGPKERYADGYRQGLIKARDLAESIQPVISKNGTWIRLDQLTKYLNEEMVKAND